MGNTKTVIAIKHEVMEGVIKETREIIESCELGSMRDAAIICSKLKATVNCFYTFQKKSQFNIIFRSTDKKAFKSDLVKYKKLKKESIT
jgi:hypothetical protein